MRSLSFYKLPLRLSYFSLKKDSPILPYTVLESHFMECHVSTLAPDNPVRAFLNSNFSTADLRKQRDLFAVHAKEQTQIKNQLQLRVESGKYVLEDVMQTLFERNILDVDIWLRLFRDCFISRFPELDETLRLKEVVQFFIKYSEKFVTNGPLHRYKFNMYQSCLDEFEFQSSFETLFRRKKPLDSLRVEGFLFKLIQQLNEKKAIDLSQAKKYYVAQLPRIKQLIRSENSMVNLGLFYNIYVFMGIQTPVTIQSLEEQMELLYKQRLQTGAELSMAEALVISNLWVNTGRFNSNFTFNDIKTLQDVAVNSQKTIHFLYCLLVVNQESQHILDHILGSINLKILAISLKIKLHKCIHILSVRNYDLQKHARLVHSLTDICNPGSSKVVQLINRQVFCKSECLSHNQKINTHRNAEQMVVSEAETISRQLDALFSSNDEYYYRSFSLCRFVTDGLVVFQGKLYGIEFLNCKEHLVRIHGQQKLRIELFSYYCIPISRIDPGDPSLHALIKAKNKSELISYIQNKNIVTSF